MRAAFLAALPGAAQTAQQAPVPAAALAPAPADAVPAPRAALQPQSAGPQAAVVSSDAAVDQRRRLLEQSAALLKMAAELKAEVDKTTKDQLSMSVIRKAAEIEKKASELRELMRRTPAAN